MTMEAQLMFDCLMIVNDGSLWFAVMSNDAFLMVCENDGGGNHRYADWRVDIPDSFLPSWRVLLSFLGEPLPTSSYLLICILILLLFLNPPKICVFDVAYPLSRLPSCFNGPCGCSNLH